MNISAIDLNLLIVFEALLIEKNVTRAAKRVGLAQSSMSGALSRLREVFDDELFIRTSSGMKPTKRALELEFFILQSLSNARKALEMPKEFDPKSCARKFVIGGTDFSAFTILPPLINFLSSNAPKVRLEMKPQLPGESVEAVCKDLVDFAITTGKGFPHNVHVKKLFTEKLMILARKGHPGCLWDMNLKKYSELQHICVTSMGEGDRIIDECLRREGLKRKPSLTVQNFLIVPYLLEKSNYVATISERVADEYSRNARIETFPFPGSLPGDDFYLIWGRLSHEDQEVLWLMKVITELMEQARYLNSLQISHSPQHLTQ